MRTREEIEKLADFKEMSVVSASLKTQWCSELIVELLLDIRDLLNKQEIQEIKLKD